MYDQNNKEDSEVDLSEFLAILWAHKFFICMLTTALIFVAGYYFITTEKQYTAKAVFEIESSGDTGFNLPGEMGALATLVGFGSANTGGSELLLERLSSKQFILRASSELDFENDTFFNKYQPQGKDPVWKAFIKRLIGWNSKKADERSLIEQSIVSSFGKFVSFETTDAGALSVVVIHRNAVSAANYANAIMEMTRNLVESEDQIATQLRLSYLSSTLADALEDVESTQQNLKDFALQNSARAQESFLSGSLKLDELRMEMKEAKEISAVLDVLIDLVSDENTSQNYYSELKLKYPLVDDVRFRRILGMSETISAWSWPDLTNVQNVSATLSDRISRLEVEISDLEGNAQDYATSAEEMAGLMREAKIAEATYTVLIEQVKSQALAAGFKPETFKVFEYATPPLSPSAPQRNLLILLGGTLGVFSGGFFAFIYAMRRGVYYTRSAIVQDVPKTLFLRSNSLFRLSKKPLDKVFHKLSTTNYIELDEASVDLANQKLIYILNVGGKSTAAGLAQMLSIQSASAGRSVALCNIVSDEREIKDTDQTIEISDLTFAKSKSGVDLRNLMIHKLAALSLWVQILKRT